MNSVLLPETQTIGSAANLVQLSDRVCAAVDEGQLTAEAVELLGAACVEALRSSSTLLRRDKTALAAACGMVEAFLSSGQVDNPVSSARVARACELCSDGWGGLLAATLLAPAWQVGAAPRLSDAPLALWPVLTEWLFRLPICAEVAGQRDAMAKHYVRRLRELVAVAEANRGSAAVGGALERYAQADCAAVLVASAIDLRELVTLRGKALSLAQRITKSEGEPALPREGRRLRVGFVIESTAESTEMRFALPWLEWLDAKRFEVVLFSTAPIVGEPEAELAGRGWELRALADSSDGGVAELAGALLDVAVFFVQPLQRANAVARLSLQRVAPLQLCLQEQGLTVGWPGADLQLVESVRAASRPSSTSAERVAILPYAGIPFVRNQGRPSATCTWSREALGLEADAVVFASLAPFSWITPEVVEAWTRILREAPKARFLVYSYAPEDATPAALNRVTGLVTNACAAYGVEPTHFILSNDVFPSLAEVLELLRLADVYLDTFPATLREGCQLALEAGLPVLCCQGAAARVSEMADWLAALGRDSGVCADPAALINRAVALASQSEARRNFASNQQAALASSNHVWDPIAFGESVGAVLESAYDQLVVAGPAGFRRDPAPIILSAPEDFESLRAEAALFSALGSAPDFKNRAARALAADPTSSAARELFYQQLTDTGESQRAIAGLLALVERLAQRADLWLLLGRNLFGSGKKADALTAYETALRIDGTNLEGWLGIAEAAVESSNWELVDEVRKVLLGLAPGDLRVRDMVGRMDHCMTNRSSI